MHVQINMLKISESCGSEASVLRIVSRITPWEYAPYGDTVGD